MNKLLIIGGIVGAIGALAGWTYYALTQTHSIVNTQHPSRDHSHLAHRDWSGD